MCTCVAYSKEIELGYRSLVVCTIYASSAYGGSMSILDTVMIVCLWFSVLLIGKYLISRWLGVPSVGAL